jgi:hypothetical protein
VPPCRRRFCCPKLQKNGGELLDVNYENTYSLNKTELLKDVKVLGFAWMGDGATIHKMPLMNIFALNGTTAPMTILIHDCTKHMEEGGKKDARYIAELFEGKVLEYDPQLHCTDVFYFDGASNVGTLQNEYIRNVPLPRVAPRIQSASHVMSHGAEPNTCYLQVPRVPTCRDPNRLLKGLGGNGPCLFSPVCWFRPLTE